MFMNLIKFLDQNEGKKIEVETERGIIRKVTLKEITYGVKYGELHIINSSNNDNVVINLNEIRNNIHLYIKIQFHQKDYFQFQLFFEPIHLLARTYLIHSFLHHPY